MNANPRNPFWGKQKEEETDYKLRYMCGSIYEKYLGPIVKANKTKESGDFAAKGYMQNKINEHRKTDLPMPKRVVQGEVPGKRPRGE